MINAMRYRVEVEGSDEVGYSAYLPELPGCVAAGETLEETKELIAEAVRLHMELMEVEGLPIPEPASMVPELVLEVSSVQEDPATASQTPRRTFHTRSGVSHRWRLSVLAACSDATLGRSPVARVTDCRTSESKRKVAHRERLLPILPILHQLGEIIKSCVHMGSHFVQDELGYTRVPHGSGELQVAYEALREVEPHVLLWVLLSLSISSCPHTRPTAAAQSVYGIFDLHWIGRHQHPPHRSCGNLIDKAQAATWLLLRLRSAFSPNTMSYI